MVVGRYAMHEIVVEVMQISRLQAGIGRIGHGRIQPAAITAPAQGQGAHEILLAVVADAGADRRRDIAGDNPAKRQLHAQTTGKGWRIGTGVRWQAAQSAAVAR